ncbi:methyltransferase domain-containing protein [Kitasatospora sp. A2-31]|uniref:methyltransferase domain-containing protein n=1 Tax=Kitasatospora sp. A2-31 TaxID=2916414 RepID=UPI001EEEFF15|nr:methyltransferase domain-containing protein [Kitasatospora sp. A2-31]MCG6499654.1 methyltransferase domain-containing protein [Kitasatospora sp. A2-31]
MTNPAHRPEQAATRSLLRAVGEALGGPVPHEWEEAITAVPRHRFLPQRIWLEDGHGGYEPCDLEADHARWFDAAYSDVPIITQVNDGRAPADPDDAWPSSSASAPSIVVRMLRDLDVRSGMKVLEIGTGTGWNAALLAHRLGPGSVASVEIDPEVARQAWASLNAAGLDVDVLCGDGSLGWGHRQPYDRIISTCSVRRVPWPWIDQTRPGGVILTPWDNPMICWGLLRLTVDRDRAQGRFSPHSAFMLIRSQRRDLRIFRDVVRDDHVPDESRTALPPSKITGDHWEARFAVGLRLGDVWTAWEDDEERLWVATTDARSWAAVDRDDAGSTVRQHGPRRLWDEVEAAHRWWEEHGRPGPERFGLTVTRRRQWTWLDHPARAAGAVRP